MSALSDLSLTKSSASLDPNLVKSIVNEIAWVIFDSYISKQKLSFKVLGVIPVSISLSQLEPFWAQAFGPKPSSGN